LRAYKKAFTNFFEPAVTCSGWWLLDGSARLAEASQQPSSKTGEANCLQRRQGVELAEVA